MSDRTTPRTEASDLSTLMFEVGRVMKAEMARSGPIPSFLHMETLRFISETKRPTMSDVADYLKVTAPTATALVNAFVKDGVILRSEDSADRRRVRLALSAKGKRLLALACEERAAAFTRVVSSLSAHDRTELARILSSIINRA